MPHFKEFPLYFEAKEELESVVINLTDEQQTTRERDQEVINALNDYYGPRKERWRRNGALFNLVQVGTEDPVSNWYLGWARILINHSTAIMSGGPPEGSFDYEGPSDFKLQVLWDALVKHQLDKSQWESHQRRFILDNHITGGGCLKAFSENPVVKEDEKWVRDFRRARTGLRARSPFRVMRSKWIANPDDVKIGVDTEDLTWNDAAQKYGNARDITGKLKYDTSQVPVGSHVRITHIEDELTNQYRIYWLSFGGEPERQLPEFSTRELGVPIYNKRLTLKRIVGEDKIEHVEGQNIFGLSNLSFSVFDPMLDVDYETHAITGMGIPEIIHGPEQIMQALVNMTIDNVKLKNTVPISYEPNDKDEPSYIDIDANTMYSGLLIDGKISAHPLGVSDVNSNAVLWDWLRQIMYHLTGINPEPLTGDGLKTAFQSGLLVRQINMRAKDRIKSWENGCFKRAWKLLLANTLLQLPLEDWVSVSDKEADQIVKMIGANEMTGEDFDTEKKKKRVVRFFPVHGFNFREDFKGENKVRTLSPDSVHNTLIGGRGKDTDKSYVPMDKTYLIPNGDVLQMLEFDVKVTGKNMLVDLKTQDMEIARTFLELGVELKAIIPEIDLRKQYERMGRIVGLESEDLFKEESGSDMLKKVKGIVERFQNLNEFPVSSPAQTSVPEVNTGESPANQGEPPRTSALIEKLANSGV